VSRALGRPVGKYVTAHFQAQDGATPVTLAYAPPSGRELSTETLSNLEEFFGAYASLAQDRHITAWLAYMPCKERVLYDHLIFSDDAPETVKKWQPSDLPRLIHELCDRYGILWIDLTVPLVNETTRSRRLLYNSMYDTHINAQGSLVVANELARDLSPLQHGRTMTEANELIDRPSFEAAALTS